MKKFGDNIEIFFNFYADSLEKINIRDIKQFEILTKEEMKIFRKNVGKLTWLAANTKPDLAVYVIDLARRQKMATLKNFTYL